MKKSIFHHLLLQAVVSGGVLIAQAGFLTDSTLSQTIVPEGTEPFSIPLNGELAPVDPPNGSPINGLPVPEASDLSTLNFSFTNTLEYGDCLEAALKLYEGTTALSGREQQSSCVAEIRENFGNDSLSQEEGRRFVSTANFYATTMLNTAIYPVRGQRVRVARFFGFIYEIDAEDPQIRELAAQAQ